MLVRRRGEGDEGGDAAEEQEGEEDQGEDEEGEDGEGPLGAEEGGGEVEEFPLHEGQADGW